MDCFEDNFSKIIVDNQSGCKLAKRLKETQTHGLHGTILDQMLLFYMYTQNLNNLNNLSSDGVPLTLVAAKIENGNGNWGRRCQPAS